MSAAQFRLGNMIAIVDVNNQQADGPSTEVTPSSRWPKLEAFGWHVQRIDGNDLNAVIAAFDAAMAGPQDMPHMIIADTR